MDRVVIFVLLCGMTVWAIINTKHELGEDVKEWLFFVGVMILMLFSAYKQFMFDTHDYRVNCIEDYEGINI